MKDLTDNTWSDLNNLKPGRNGAVEGVNTITVQDVAGNTASLTITLDVTAPTVTDVAHEWQTKGGGRDSITVTFSEAVTGLSQGWYGSETSWNKVFFNTKAHTFTFVDQAGNVGTYTVAPNAAPVVAEDPTPIGPEAPSEPSEPTLTDPEIPSEPSSPVPSDPASPSAPIEKPSGISPEPSNQNGNITPTGTQPVSTPPLKDAVVVVTPPSAVTPTVTITPTATIAPTQAVKPTLPVTGAPVGLLGGLSGLLVALGVLLKRFF